MPEANKIDLCVTGADPRSAWSGWVWRSGSWCPTSPSRPWSIRPSC